MQVSGEGLANAEHSLSGMSEWRRKCGVYVGCMFVDNMMLLQAGYGFASTGPVMTGC